MSRDRQIVDIQIRHTNPGLAQSLNGVAMDESTGAMDNISSRCDGLQDARLVVHQHQRYKRYLPGRRDRGDAIPQRVEIDNAFWTYEPGFVGRRETEHRVVFYGGHDQRGRPVRKHGPQRGLDGFCAAAGENDIIPAGPYSRCYPLTRHLDKSPGATTFRMHRGGITRQRQGFC
jgi:hypothetical protein